MNDYQINLSRFPQSLHRIVKTWYQWQVVNLRKRGSYPGKEQRAPERWETEQQIFWGARPPEMTNDSELALEDDAGLSYYLVPGGPVYYIDEQERGSRGRYWMFRNYEDAEKCLLFLISQAARPGKYSDSPRFRWYQEGLNPNVILHNPDPENFPGRVSLTVDQEPIDRGWMGENDAVAFSHAIVMAFEELDAAMRHGIPPEWFDVNVIGN